MWRHRAVCVSGLVLVLGGGVGMGQVQAQEKPSPKEMVSQARRNLRSSPVDAQRTLREVIADINMDPLGQQYQKVKGEAFFLLGESYFNGGRIADAVAQFDSVKTLAGEEDKEYKKAVEYQEEIGRLFRPLRIKVKNREIPLLSYIEGVKIEFLYPKRLDASQINRLQILQDPQSYREDEFLFAGIDADGRPFMEVKYFPVVTFSGRSVGYSLIIKGGKEERRYRFNFTSNETQPLEIYWEDEAGWKLVEKVPEDLVKLELPDKYRFRPAQALPIDKFMERRIKPLQHIYIPAEAQTELVLEDSEDSGWERAYGIALYVLTGTAMFLGLWGAR